MRVYSKCFLILIISFLLVGICLGQNSDCIPDPTITDPEGHGVRHPKDLPLAFKEESYECTLTIIAPQKADTWGFDIRITKIQIIELVNLPPGLSWETNTGNNDDYMTGGEKYCMKVVGVPGGLAGIHKIDVYANAWVKVVFEMAAPGNPRNGGSVNFTLCNKLSLNLGPDITLKQDEEIIISANQNTSYHRYEWHDGSTNSTYLVKGSELGIGEHEISVTVFDTVGTTGIHSGKETKCLKTDAIKVNVIAANNINTDCDKIFSVFPNPSINKVFIQNNFPENLFEYEILCTSSKVLQSGLLISKNQEIDITGLKSGLYFVRIKGNSAAGIIKLIVF